MVCRTVFRNLAKYILYFEKGRHYRLGGSCMLQSKDFKHRCSLVLITFTEEESILLGLF